MDFIFGTFATDELKVVHHRTARRGVQHQFALHPRDPAPGQPVTLQVQIGTDLTADHVACYYTLDGTTPAGRLGTATNGYALPLAPVDTTWDAVAWGYVTGWEGTLPAQVDGTAVRYRLGAWREGAAPDEEVFADWPNVRDTAERAAAAFFRKKTLPDIPPNGASQGEVFSYHVDRLSPPDWAARTPIYQVFVDRFYPGDGQEWQQTDDLRGIMGGTLWGVRDKLDYIAALNVGCIWLSPTWSTPSHHGYDVTDYYHVAPHLGGEEALHALVDAAHARGLRVLLDMVCNHVSHQHPIFQAALADPASEYRDWFYFEDPASPATADASGPDSAKPTIGYRTFFGVPSMPQINVGHLPARRWLLDIARYWLREFDVDGYRLDYANGPGPGFWSDFRAACRLEKPDCFCFGEIVDQPSALLPYVGRLDGCLDFHIGEALRKTYAYGVWTDADLERFLARHEAYFAATAGNFVRPTFIDNHDMDRFLHAARGNQTALRRAAAVQMRLSGPPIIYYGTEIGLGQRRSKADGFGLEVSREPMMWGSDQNADLLNHYRSLITAWRHRHG